MDQARLETLCDAWLAAWTGNDPDRLLDHYAKDAYYEDPAKPQGLHGHDQMRPYLTRLLATYPTWTWKRKTLHPIPDGFVVTHEATIPLPGQAEPLNERCIDIVHLDKNNKITHNEVYFDRARWMQALGKNAR